MKVKPLAVMFVCAVIMIISAPAHAQYMWMDSSGLETAMLGEEVDISLYFHAEEDDIIYGWGMNMGFDDTAIGGAELTYVSFEYGLDQSVLATDEAVGYLPGAATNAGHEGESLFHAGKYDWGFRGYSIDAGEDSLLFTATFVFDGGIWDGEDAWIEWDKDYPNESYFDNETGYLTHLTIEGGGPDFAAVPIPGAIFLLAPAFLGLIGLRRKKA